MIDVKVNGELGECNMLIDGSPIKLLAELTMLSTILIKKISQGNDEMLNRFTHVYREGFDFAIKCGVPDDGITIDLGAIQKMKGEG